MFAKLTPNPGRTHRRTDGQGKIWPAGLSQAGHKHTGSLIIRENLPVYSLGGEKCSTCFFPNTSWLALFTACSKLPM